LYNKSQLAKSDGDDPQNFVAAIEEEPEEEEKLATDEEEEEIEIPPPVHIDEIPAVIEVKLSAEELAKLEEERKHYEEEEKKDKKNCKRWKKKH